MITAIGHMAFVIKDLEQSLDFYCNKLGFRQAFILDREGTPSPWIVYIQVAPGHYLELFPGGKEEHLVSFDHVGFNHLCLLVDDMPATLRQLRERGLEITGEPQMGLDHNWQYWLTDPDGNRIELMQITSESPHSVADANWLT